MAEYGAVVSGGLGGGYIGGVYGVAFLRGYGAAYALVGLGGEDFGRGGGAPFGGEDSGRGGGALLGGKDFGRGGGAPSGGEDFGIGGDVFLGVDLAVVSVGFLQGGAAIALDVSFLPFFLSR